MDFSFKLHWIGSGDWGNHTEYAVEVSNTKRDIIPEKEAMHVPEVSTIDISQIKKSRRPLFPV